MSDAQSLSTPQPDDAVTDDNVDLEAAAQATDRIGERLADLRARQNLRITELARRISVSPSLISQIERGQSRPSVTTLFGLSQALGVPVDAFFLESTLGDERRADDNATSAPPTDAPPAPSSEDSEREYSVPDLTSAAGGYLLRRAERPTLDIRGGVRWERLTRTALKAVEFMELVYAPGAESDPQLYRHPGIELVVVTENRLDITVGFEVNQLETGDSIAFPSSMPHRYVNPTDHESRAVTAILRDDLSTLSVSGT